ncbi:hypothetical protein EOM81_07835 [bacterium]|nr:hypothetical protein [bacterium]
MQETPNADSGPKWFNSPLTICNGSIEEIKKHIPDFERQPFSLGGVMPARANIRLETIIAYSD